MDQPNMKNLEEIDNNVLNEPGLSTLDEAMLPNQTHKGENQNCTVDNDTELSESMRAWNEEDHKRRQQIM